MGVFPSLLHTLAAGHSLDVERATAAFEALMEGNVPDAAIGAFLMALKQRGETAEELIGGAKALRARAVGITAPATAVDTCGTGGGWSSFNVSTAAALVAAGAGAVVTKHGNRTVTRKSGSADVLEALGVNLGASPDVAAICLAKVGVCFLYAPAHHAAMRHVGAARKAMGLRTVFNIIGPLANPAGTRRQLIGVNEPRLLPLMADALIGLGVERAMVVHGQDGLDEITTTGPTSAVLVEGEQRRDIVLHPGECGLMVRSREALEGGDPQANAAGIRAMLSGSAGPLRDIACLNAGAALMLADRAVDLPTGVRLAQNAIDTGDAARALDGLVRLTNAPLAQSASD